MGGRREGGGARDTQGTMGGRREGGGARDTQGTMGGRRERGGTGDTQGTMGGGGGKEVVPETHKVLCTLCTHPEVLGGGGGQPAMAPRKRTMGNKVTDNDVLCNCDSIAIFKYKVIASWAPPPPHTHTHTMGDTSNTPPYCLALVCDTPSISYQPPSCICPAGHAHASLDNLYIHPTHMSVSCPSIPSMFPLSHQCSLYPL